MKKIRSALNSRLLIAAVLAAGILYLFVLQASTPDGAYFSGDSGMKALLSQDIAAGQPGFDLKFNDAPWIQSLWAAGMFPYHAPYLYQLGGKYYITFPYTFPLVTAPFYAWWGYRGLYVVPILSTLAIWLLLVWACRKLGLSPFATALGAAVLIFTTHLALYSAMYWEHTLSVALAFAGLAILIPASKEDPKGLGKPLGSGFREPDPEGLGKPSGSSVLPLGSLILSGILTGLAPWFRPEQIFLVVFLDGLVLYAWLRPRLRTPRLPHLGRIAGALGEHGWVYLAASTLTLLLYGLTNWLIYHDFFGAHAIQVIQDAQPLLSRWLSAVGNFQLMTVGAYSLFAYVPIVLFPLALLALSWIKPAWLRFERDGLVWLAFCLAFIIGVALLVPPGAGGKQWGPRFLLLLAPLIALVFTWQVDHLLKHPPAAGRLVLALGVGVLVALSAFGIYQNPYHGIKSLRSTYTQITPAVDALRASPAPVVAIPDDFVGMVLQPAVQPGTVFLMATDEGHLALLSKALLDSRQNTFNFICYANDCRLFDPEVKTRQVQGLWANYNLHILRSGEYGKYLIYTVQAGRTNEGIGPAMGCYSVLGC